MTLSSWAKTQQARPGLFPTLGAKVLVAFFTILPISGYSLNGFAKWTPQLALSRASPAGRRSDSAVGMVGVPGCPPSALTPISMGTFG